MVFAVFSQLYWTLLLLAFQPACTSFSASTLASVFLSVWSFTSARQYIVQRFCHHLCKRVLTFFLACLPRTVSSPFSNCQFSRWICRPTCLSKLKLVCYQVPRTSFLLACQPACWPALLVSTSANVLQGYLKSTSDGIRDKQHLCNCFFNCLHLKFLQSLRQCVDQCLCLAPWPLCHQVLQLCLC